MNLQQAMAAFAELARTSPSCVGSRVDHSTQEVIRACTRCGAEDRKKLPAAVSDLIGRAGRVSPGFDEELFAWMRSFSDAHQGCSSS